VCAFCDQGRTEEKDEVAFTEKDILKLNFIYYNVCKDSIFAKRVLNVNNQKSSDIPFEFNPR